MKASLSPRFLNYSWQLAVILNCIFFILTTILFQIRVDDGSVLLLLLCDSNFNGKIRITSVDKKNIIN